MSFSDILPAGSLKGERITEKDIAWLWVSLTKVYGYKFWNCYGEKDDGIWFQGLKNFSRADLAHGFKKLLESLSKKDRKTGESWPPNLNEFRMLCERKLSDYGLPDVHRAFLEVEKNEWRPSPQWSHPIVAEAASHLKPDPMAHRGMIFAQFSTIYEELVQDYLRQQE